MTPQPNNLETRYRDTRAALDAAVEEYARPPGSVRLVAVGKRHPADKILRLARLGHRDFAENYLQEAEDKIGHVSRTLARDPGQSPAPCWHFIGHIQSRKARAIAGLFDWVHTLESGKVARKLSEARADGPPLKVLIQLNLQQEAGKSGIGAGQLADLAHAVSELPGLALRGLMIIPRPETDFERQRAVFRACREQLEQLNGQGFELDQLSMGMTGDMPAAIAEGATMVRVGVAIFGPRPD